MELIKRKDNAVIFFWQGSGVIIIALIFGSLLIGNLICNALLGEQYWDVHKWPLGVSLVGAAAVCGLFAQYKKGNVQRVVVDKETGQEIVLEERHSLFFIPIKWWSLILIIGAISAFIVEWKNGGGIAIHQ